MADDGRDSTEALAELLGLPPIQPRDRPVNAALAECILSTLRPVWVGARRGCNVLHRTDSRLDGAQHRRVSTNRGRVMHVVHAVDKGDSDSRLTNLAARLTWPAYGALVASLLVWALIA